MKQSINFEQFVDGFKAYDRGDSFSYDGFKALFNYFEDLEEDCDMDIEFDVIAIDCEYAEHTLQEVIDNYSILDELDLDDDCDDDGQREAVLDWLNDRTQVIDLDDDVIILNF